MTKSELLPLFGDDLTSGPYRLVEIDGDCSRWRCRHCATIAWATPVPARPAPRCWKCGAQQ